MKGWAELKDAFWAAIDGDPAERARQLAEQKGRSYEEALTHLLELMQQGWAAKDRDG